MEIFANLQPETKKMEIYQNMHMEIFANLQVETKYNGDLPISAHGDICKPPA